MVKDIYFIFLQYLYAHPFLAPLGIIGIWRWSVWLFKEIIARNYRPEIGNFKGKVSIITPVYNEDPKVFLKALQSWKKNKPSEIIAVIDYSDRKCINIFRKSFKGKRFAKLIITKVPGKRPALALGIKKAKSEIVALVDSDTIWDKDVIKNGIVPFKNKKTAGVATYQNVLNPKSLAQRIFDLQLDLRYCDEMPFLAVSGDALVCLSGRTAFYRRSVILPLLSDLVNETFMGKKVISGDDKRLTYLVLEKGYKVAYQANSHVYTPGMKDLRAYLKQRLRWTRNGLRADLKAIRSGWPLKHAALIFFQIDKAAQAVVVVLSPIYFVISLVSGFYEVALVILAWWFVSRGVKMYPHLKRRPQDIVILPAFVIYTFLTAILKVYAFFTLNTQGWITRWDKSRLPSFKFVELAPGYAATIVLILLLGIGVYLAKDALYFKPLKIQQETLANTLPQNNNSFSRIDGNYGLSQDEDDLKVKKYKVLPGDSIESIADRFKINSQNLLFANISHLTNWNAIKPGMFLNIPGKGIKISFSQTFNFLRIHDDILEISFDHASNTINVAGRGKEVSLSDIETRFPEYIKEVDDGIWELSKTLYMRSGTTLNLRNNEVKWLRLISDKKSFATLRAINANVFMEGTRISSWDASKKDYDTDLSNGRAFILVKDGSRMDLSDSEISYLGYPRTPNLTVSPYGISWRMSNGKLGTTILTGEIKNSKFHHNYFGAYTFGATGMIWKGNEFYQNIRYGLDLHDDSNGFLIENNISHDNGSHGFIISKRCVNNIFRNNRSFGNKGHGIMLHEKSDNNLLEGNILYNNTDGLAIWHSSGNLIRSNRIENNKNGIRANSGSSNNLIIENQISKNKQYGIYLYTGSNKNTIEKNKILGNKIAVYIKSKDNFIVNNVIEDSSVGLYFLSEANGNKVSDNQIRYSTKYGIYTKVNDGHRNEMGKNLVSKNRQDVVTYKK